MPHVLAVNMTDPEGKERKAGDPVPATWGKAYIADLVRTGGAKDVSTQPARPRKAR